MKKLLAADIGFASTGMAVFEYGLNGWELFDARCLHTTKGKDRLVCLDDVRRTEVLATGVMNYFLENQCSAMVCEIPTGGAQSSTAQKCMAAASAMIATVRLVLACPIEWVTPTQSRAAAGWTKGMKEGIKHLKPNERTKELKRFVMAQMVSRHPAIKAFKLADMEHIADACATFEAARTMPMIQENYQGEN